MLRIKLCSRRFHKKMINKNKLYTRVVVLFLASILGLTLSILAVTSFMVNKNVLESYKKLVWSSVDAVDQRFSQCIDAANEKCFSIYESEESTYIRLMRPSDAVFRNRFYKNIRNDMSIMPYLHSIYIVNRNHEATVSFNNGRLDKYEEQTSKDALIEQLSKSQGEMSPVLWDAQNKYQEKATFTLLATYYQQEEPSSMYYGGTVIANLETVALSRHLFPYMTEEPITYYIFDDVGKIVASSVEIYCGENWSDKEFISKITNSEEEYFKKRLDGEMWEFFAKPSSSDGFYIVAQSPSINKVLEYHAIMMPLCIVIGIIAICGIVVACFLVFRMFKPLNIIFDKARSYVDEKGVKEEDDIKILTKYHHILMDDVQKLKDKDQKNQIVKALLMQQNIDSILIDKGYIYWNSRYRILSVCFGQKKERIVQQGEYAKYMSIFEKLCVERLNTYGQCFCFEVGLRRMLVLIAIDDAPDSSEDTLYHETYQILREISECFDLPIVAYLSDSIKVGDNTRNCSAIFQKAKSHMRTQSFLEKSNQVDLLEEKMPLESWEKLFLQAKQCAQNCKKEGFKKNIEEILECLKGQSWELCSHVILKLAIEIHQIHAKSETMYEFEKNAISKIDTMEGTDELLTWLEELLDNVTKWTENKSNENSVSMMERMAEFINANYHDSELNLNSLAVSMHISAAYLGKLFRNFTGKSFNEYILSVRMEHARELLLLKPEDNVSAIANAVGYQNISYFTSIFKKYYGVSPSAYRRYYSEYEENYNEMRNC